MIKQIHQTWKTVDIPHDVYPEAWVDSWREMNPEWEYSLWTDEDNEKLVKDCYPAFWEDYSKIKQGVVKSDIARLLYMHRYGGIYADLDFICLKDFDPLIALLGDKIIFGSHANNRQPIPNAWLYSPVGETFWLSVVTDALRDLRAGVDRAVEQIAGPERLNWAIKAHQPDCTILASDLIYPHAWGDFICDKKADLLDWGIVDSLKEGYKDSFAVTRWTHNW